MNAPSLLVFLAQQTEAELRLSTKSLQFNHVHRDVVLRTRVGGWVVPGWPWGLLNPPRLCKQQSEHLP